MQAPPEIQAMFGTPGERVPRVKASDIRTVWKLGRESEARAMAHNPEFKRGQLAIGAGLVQHVCSPGTDVNAAWFRSSRLGMLMMRCGKQDVQPPAILFSIFAKLPMKWWVPGEIHRGLF